MYGNAVQLYPGPTLKFNATEDVHTVQRRIADEKSCIIEPVTPRQYADGVDPTLREYKALVFDSLDDIQTDPETGAIEILPIPESTTEAEF